MNGTDHLEPEPERRKPIAPAVVLGLLLIGTGLALYLDRLGLADAQQLLRWWPLGLSALGLARLLSHGALNLGGHGMIAGGLALQLGYLGRADLLELGWPLLLVWLGLVLVGRALWPRYAEGGRGGRRGRWRDRRAQAGWPEPTPPAPDVPKPPCDNGPERSHEHDA